MIGSWQSADDDDDDDDDDVRIGCLGDLPKLDAVLLPHVQPSRHQETAMKTFLKIGVHGMKEQRRERGERRDEERRGCRKRERERERERETERDRKRLKELKSMAGQ